MNARFYLPIVALCVAGVLAGCGSVTEGIAFAPPSGWTSTPAMFGRFQMWMKNTQEKNTTQMVMLVRGDANNMHADFNVLPPQYAKDVKVMQHGNVTLCGTQPAEQFVAQGTDNSGKRSQIEMFSSVIGKNRYLAMYLRPANAPADPSAEAAIHSLCPMK